MDDAPPDAVDLARSALGEPEATFGVSLARLLPRLLVAGGLLLYGVGGNLFWWGWGPARFNHLTIVLLFTPPLTGLAIVRHVHRSRGLRALVYPSGLLRLHGRRVESFPWDDIALVRLKAPDARHEFERTEAGPVVGSVLHPRTPRWRIGDAWLEVARSDGTSATFTPALADYAEFAELVQRRTFARLYGEAAAGGLVWFGPFAVGPAGLFWGDEAIPWADVTGAAAEGGRLVLRLKGRWRLAKSAALEEVANPHVALALIAGRGA